MKSLAVLLFVFAAQISMFAQASEKEIAAVRAEVKAINDGARKLKKETKNVLGLSLEGAEATYFLSDKEIVKITAKFFGETYNSDVEIFYRSGAPIFIYSKQNRYDAPLNPNQSPKIVGAEERRIYYADGKTIKIMIGKDVIKNSDARYADTQNSLKRLSDDLLKAYAEGE